MHDKGVLRQCKNRNKCIYANINVRKRKRVLSLQYLIKIDIFILSLYFPSKRCQNQQMIFQRKRKILSLQGSWKKLFGCFIKTVAKIPNNFEKNSANPYLFSQINSLIHNIFAMIVRTKDIDVLIDEAIAKWISESRSGHLELYQASFIPVKPSKGWREFVRGSGKIVFRVDNSKQDVKTYIQSCSDQKIFFDETFPYPWVGDRVIHDYKVLKFYDALQIANKVTSASFKAVIMRFPLYYGIVQPFYAFELEDGEWIIVNFDGTIGEIKKEDYETIKSSLTKK